MARKNIFEVLVESYNIQEEIIKLENLFSSPVIQYSSNISYFRETTTLYGCADNVFHLWDAVRPVLNVQEFREKTKLSSVVEKIGQKQNLESNEIISYLEMIYNLVALIKRHYFLGSNFTIEYGRKILDDAISVMQSAINHLELTVLELPKKGSFELVIADPLAIQVAETVPEELSVQTLRYHHHLLKGDLTAKRNILLNIGLHIEGEGIRKKLKGNNFERLDRDIGFFLNGVKIRHANSDQKVSDLSNEELEKWYDRAYDLFLLGIATTNYIDIRPEIKKFSKFLDDVKED